MLGKPWQELAEKDHEVYACIESEFKRQEEGIELIASENFASEAVISSMANIMTNKYAEGRPSKRYYGGCQHVDTMENLAIERVCNLFSCNHANVQPHSGAQANAAAFLALIKPGDKILGLDLSNGGHLTHGSVVNFSGIHYKPHFYHLDTETELLNYDQIENLAESVKPQLIIAGASAYPRHIDFKRFREIADKVGAYLLVDMSHIAGLVATSLHQSPIPYAHVVTSTTHKTLRGPRGGIILWNDEKLTASINKGVFPGTQGGPLEHIIASKAVAFREASFESFKTYQKLVVQNSQVLAKELISLGFKIITGGSDNHLVLMDLSSTETSGKALEEALEKVFITVNKNTVPKEKRSPFVTSGIRLGTPAVSTRGMGESEMKKIANYIHLTYKQQGNDEALAKIGEEVKTLAKQFPLYSEWTKSK